MRSLLAAVSVWGLLLGLGISAWVGGSWVWYFLVLAGVGWFVLVWWVNAEPAFTPPRSVANGLRRSALSIPVWLYVVAFAILAFAALVAERRGALATDAATAALLLWVVSTASLALLRAESSWPRYFGVAAVVTLPAAAWMGIAFFIGGTWALRIAAAFAVGVTALVATGLNVVLPAPQTSAASVQGWTRFSRRVAWVGATGLILAAATYGATISQPVSRDELGRRGAAPGELQPDVSSGEALLRYYAPVLRLDEGETWRASDADAAAALASKPTCQGTPPPCGSLQFSSTQLAALLDPANNFVVSGTDRATVDSGPVYPHVVQIGQPPNTSWTGNLHNVSTAPSSGKPSSVEGETRWVLEYWLFYAGDNWKATSAVGTITQGHLGDWEMVGVGLDGAMRPLFVAYSEHCGGAWRPWTDAWTVATDDTGVLVPKPGITEATHPLVEVARGSHANYPTTQVRSPDWLGCAQGSGAQSRAINAVSSILNVRESVGAFGELEITEPKSDDDPALSDPWYWGSDDSTNLGHLPLERGGLGPVSPMYHTDLWLDPLSIIFHDERGRWDRG